MQRKQDNEAKKSLQNNEKVCLEGAKEHLCVDDVFTGFAALIGTEMGSWGSRPRGVKTVKVQSYLLGSKLRKLPCFSGKMPRIDLRDPKSPLPPSVL